MSAQTTHRITMRIGGSGYYGEVTFLSEKTYSEWVKEVEDSDGYSLPVWEGYVFNWIWDSGTPCIVKDLVLMSEVVDCDFVSES